LDGLPQYYEDILLRFVVGIMCIGPGYLLILDWNVVEDEVECKTSNEELRRNMQLQLLEELERNEEMKRTKLKDAQDRKRQQKEEREATRATFLREAKLRDLTILQTGEQRKEQREEENCDSQIVTNEATKSPKRNAPRHRRRVRPVQETETSEQSKNIQNVEDEMPEAAPLEEVRGLDNQVDVLEGSQDNAQGREEIGDASDNSDNWIVCTRKGRSSDSKQAQGSLSSSPAFSCADSDYTCPPTPENGPTLGTSSSIAVSIAVLDDTGTTEHKKVKHRDQLLESSKEELVELYIEADKRAAEFEERLVRQWNMIKAIADRKTQQ